MDKPRVRIYTDYKSPYAFVANQRLFELEEAHNVELEWLHADRAHQKSSVGCGGAGQPASDMRFRLFR